MRGTQKQLISLSIERGGSCLYHHGGGRRMIELHQDARYDVFFTENDEATIAPLRQLMHTGAHEVS